MAQDGDEGEWMAGPNRQERLYPGFQDTAGSFAGKEVATGRQLVASGLLSPDQLAGALRRQEASGAPLGTELVSGGAVRAFDFHRAEAALEGRPFVNLMTDPPDPALLEPDDLPFYLQAQCLPWRQRDGTFTFAAVNPSAAMDLLAEKTGAPCLVYQTSSLDILWSIQAHFTDHMTDAACHALDRTFPAASAKYLLNNAHKAGLASVTLIALAISVAFPGAALLTLNAFAAVAFIALACLRFVSIWIGRKQQPALSAPTRPDRELPLYSILVPLFREAEVLPILTDALQRLDYPASKLDIKLVLEEGDEATINAARQLALPGHFELIVVPGCAPTTKPKACNYALAFARGDFVVVYDAEDMPGPGQLREAVAAFDAQGPGLACLQAPLAYYNWRENWLTRHFALEYAAIFDLLLPALVRLGQPIPLGGTSTHFRTSILRRVGAWDPFNVTEDADLGFRLHEAGFRTGVLRTPTLEEANCVLPGWVRQRSRWLKGWMQTYLVRMRHPRRSFRELRAGGFFAFQVVIGAFLLSALVHPFFYAMAAYGFLFVPLDLSLNGPLALATINLSVLVLGFSAAILSGLAGAGARGLNGLALHALTMPAYWLLISFSAYRALFQLVTDPHYWEKTPHGLSALVPDYLARARRKSGPFQGSLPS